MSIATLAIVSMILVSFLKQAIAIKISEVAEEDWLHIKEDLRKSVAILGYFLKEIISIRDFLIPLIIVALYSSTKALMIIFTLLMIPGLLI